jgi:Ca2+-binding RTX toxin-like protein
MLWVRGWLRGNDVIHAELTSNFVLFGGEGNDSLYVGRDSLAFGGNGDDMLFGNVENNRLYGGAGADILYGNGGNDELYGDSGDDILYGNVGNDKLYGGAGDDTIYTSSTADIRWINNGDDIVYGGAGNDQIISGEGNHQIYGEEGDDFIALYKFTGYVSGGNGNDIISLDNSSKQTLYGEDGNDQITVNNGTENTLIGGDGDDTLIINYGSDSILDGGVGYDTYSVLAAKNVIIKDKDFSGNIKIDAVPSYYAITGVGDRDFFAPISNQGDLKYSTGNNKYFNFTKFNKRHGTLYFDATAGTFDYKLDVETIKSYEGIAINKYYNMGDKIFSFEDMFNKVELDKIRSMDVTIVTNNNIGYGYGTAYDYFLDTKISMSDFIDQGSVKSIYGSGDDVIYGITGYAGDRYVFIGPNDAITPVEGLTRQTNIVLGDTIFAGAGNDRIFTGAGSSIVFAEEGNDYIVAADIFAPDTIFGDAGDDIIYTYDPTLATQLTVDPYANIRSSYNYQNLRGIDEVSGGTGNDHIYIGDQTAKVYGDAGNDTIVGRDEGADINGQYSVVNQFYGGEGNDFLQGTGKLYGGEGNDTLVAGSSGTYLDGGAGADSLVGGLGDDTYVIDDLDTYTEEKNNGGHDALIIGLSVDLQGRYFEDVTLTGTANFYAKGNDANNRLIGNSGDNYLDGRGGADYLEGGEGGDYYVLTSEDTYLENGSTGVDTIERWYETNRVLAGNIENLVLKGNAKSAFGNSSNNVITGNEQNNYMSGSAGNDTIVIGKGGGTDTLSFTDRQSASDTLRLTGIAASDLTAQRYSGQDSIYFSIKGTNDHFWLSDYYKAATDNGDGTFSDSKVDRIVFDSGIVWTASDIQTQVDRAANDKAPIVNANPPALNGSQNIAFSYSFAANTIVDPDPWDTVTYSITLTTKNASGQYNSIPSWLTFDPVTRTLSGTPTSSNVGTLQLYIWGTDMYGKGAAAGVTLKISPPNVPPVLANPVPDQTYAIGALFSYTLASNAFTDPDSDALTYQLTQADGSALPTWLSFNTSTKKLTGTSPNNISAPLTLKITATDTAGNSTSDLFDLKFTAQNLTLSGTSAADTLSGGAGNDNLSGLAGNDILNGNAGNDTLDGGAGNDTMVGGLGNDIYVVDSTSDIVTENASEGTDTIQTAVTLSGLAANVENLTLLGTTALNATGNSLNNVITGNSAANTLDGGVGNDTLIGGAGNDIYIIDTISDVVTEVASQGTDTIKTTVTLANLAANVENLTLLGTTALNGTGNSLNNILTGNSAANTLNGGAGNDTLIGGLGDDIYIVDSTSDVVTETAGQGTDTIQTTVTLTSLAANVENLTLIGTAAINGTGNALANIFIGNSAANSFMGGAGNDTYNINRSSGADSIVENDTTTGNQDLLQFASDIRANQLWFRHVGTDLEVSVIGTSNSATIKNWYTGNPYHVEQFKSGDGKALTDAKVQNLVNAMAGMAPPAAGQTDLTASYQTSLNPVLVANWT